MRQSTLQSKVAPSNGLAVSRTLSLSASDVALVQELIRYAVESMRDVITEEEKWQARGHRPIFAELERYVSEATALLARIS